MVAVVGGGCGVLADGSVDCGGGGKFTGTRAVLEVTMLVQMLFLILVVVMVHVGVALVVGQILRDVLQVLIHKYK